MLMASTMFRFVHANDSMASTMFRCVPEWPAPSFASPILMASTSAVSLLHHRATSSIELRPAPSIQRSLFSIHCSASSRIERNSVKQYPSFQSMQHAASSNVLLRYIFYVQEEPVICKSSCKTVSRVASICRLVHGSETGRA
jgi:hypothetical protein